MARTAKKEITSAVAREVRLTIQNFDRAHEIKRDKRSENKIVKQVSQEMYKKIRDGYSNSNS